MDADLSKYFEGQPLDRKDVLQQIHAIILEEDDTVIPVLEPMMGKEMIVYKSRGMMKYALASVKNHMSLHVLPMYASPVLFEKFQKLLPRAAFQKGCMNFHNADDMPLKKVKQIFAECSGIDMVRMREDQLKERKAGKKMKK